MRNIVKIKPVKDSALLTMEVENGEIKIINFKISNLIGEETGWMNEGSSNKIYERTKYLKTNVYTYEKKKLYDYVSVIKNLNDIVNKSDDKLKSIRKVMEILEGYNCVGTTRIKVSVNDEQMNLQDFHIKYLK